MPRAREYTSSIALNAFSESRRAARRSRQSASSDDFGAEEIVHVERAEKLLLFVDDEDLTDLVTLHQLDRFGGEALGRDGARRCAHHVRDSRRVEVGAALEAASQVAVGVDADD